MLEDPKRAELDAAYRAVMALLDIADTADLRFRVAVMDENEWGRGRKPSHGQESAAPSGTQRLELSRCSAAIAPFVFRHVLGIAQTPIFGERCLNGDDGVPEAHANVAHYVIYLETFSSDMPAVQTELPEVEAGGLRIHASGLRPVVGKRNSA